MNPLFPLFLGKIKLARRRLTAAFYSTPGTAHWNPYADINGNGIKDIIDIAVMAKNFGVTT
jgi:hypothetical protein